MVKPKFLLTSIIRNIYLALLFILAITSCCSNVSVLATNHGSKQVKVGFVSNLHSPWGIMAHDFINMAISDFYMMHPTYETRLLLQARDSQNDVITSAARVTDLVLKEKVVAIIGPETSQEAQFDINLGERYKVPMISYSASSPTLSSPYFFQATQDDSCQVEAISSIIQYFGWGEVTPVYVNNEFGGGIIPFLVDELQQNNIRIPYRSVISSSATNDQIRDNLAKLKERQTRVFVVHMNETMVSRLFFVAHQSGMMSSDYVWIVTSGIANAFWTYKQEVVHSMQGVLGVKTYRPKTSYDAVKKLKARWGKNYVSLDSYLDMSMYGYWAYDATFLLAKAVEEVHGNSNEFGPQLIEKLVNASVEGLSGEFRLVNKKLQTDIFKIINVVGNGEKEIGYWTSKKGLVRDVNGSNNSASLGNIIWPGDRIIAPKGWVIPKKQKPLKIGVPIKTDFTEFVEASNNNAEGEPKGFCIDVFDAVREKLSYDLPVKYIPSSSSYNELIYKVHTKEYDAVVGDVTIIANRSLYVDFALPYMESDVLMVVSAVKGGNGDRIWAFLKPLSWKLWVITLCFFVLIAVVVWVNEHDINDEFRQNSWKGQIGLYLFYSFSTMVFSNKEVPKSNIVRLVMVLWVFTLLLITQSYTANLASLLTVEKLKPQYTDITKLLSEKKNIGYQNGTFVSEYLERMGFHESNVKPYATPQELHKLLSKGSDRGGIDAAFDEEPYIKLFLSRHCSEYMTVVPPISRTDGFAFAFPRGSPLVSDISRAVLNITEGNVMSDLSKKWLNSSFDCSTDSWENQSGNTLDLDGFEVLFGITGGLCVAAIIWKLYCSVYRKRKSVGLRIREDDGSANGGRLSVKKRLVTKLRTFRVSYKGRRRVSRSSSVVSPETEITTLDSSAMEQA